MAGAYAPKRENFWRRVSKTAAIIACSSWGGGMWVKRKIESETTENNLALNLMSLPKDQRLLFGNLQKLQQSPQTNETYVACVDSLLNDLRALKANAATHHVVRIQAASSLAEYYDRMDKVAAANGTRTLKEGLQLRAALKRRKKDMAHAFDLIDFGQTVSPGIARAVRISKMQYARVSRDYTRMRKSYDELLEPIRSQAIHEEDDDEKEEEHVEDAEAAVLQDDASEAGDKEEEEDGNEDGSVVVSGVQKKVETQKKEVKREKTEGERRALAIAKAGNLDGMVEPEIMTLFTHSPYLGEWRRFVKIGDALCKQYSTLKVSRYSHSDGVDMADLYAIAKDLDLERCPVPAKHELRFGLRPFTSVKVALREAFVESPNAAAVDLLADNAQSELLDVRKNAESELQRYLRKNAGVWRTLLDDQRSPDEKRAESGTVVGGYTTAESRLTPSKRLAIEMQQMERRGLVAPGIRCIGAVQKGNSMTGLVHRVQGPVLSDGRLLMRGSALLRVPTTAASAMVQMEEKRTDIGTQAIDAMADSFTEAVPSTMGRLALSRVGSFERVRQTEEWSLAPDISARNTLTGTLTITRESVPKPGAKFSGLQPTVKLVFDCKVQLGQFDDSGQ